MLSDADGIRVLPLFIANRGEIALRIQRSASLFPLSLDQSYSNVRFLPLSIYTRSEANAAHVLAVPSSQRILLPKDGPRAYLDIPTLISLAKKHNAWGVAPGYGFLSESVEFARAVEENGMVWIGPNSNALDLFGNKGTAKQLAQECNVPVLEGSQGGATIEQVISFIKQQPNSSKSIIKAVAGGGGRGMRIVDSIQEKGKGDAIREAYDSCVREAKGSFGDERVYVERYLQNARHIEVQIIGDGSGDVAHLWERECSLQRRHQKLIEIAPSPTLSSLTRQTILEAALCMAGKGKYKNLGTFEFLYLASSGEFFFMEANPRIQVEHTVTEQITSLDLVALQLQVAAGAQLKELGLGQYGSPLRFPTLTSIQVRVNAEQMQQDGTVLPTSGTLHSINMPSGPGIRIDTSLYAPLYHGQVKYQHDPAFDSLLAKIIFTAPSYASAVHLASTRLRELEIVGVETNVFLLIDLLETAQVKTNKEVHTRFVEDNIDDIYRRLKKLQDEQKSAENSVAPSAGAVVDVKEDIPHGQNAIDSPLAGLVVEILVKEGDNVQAGQQVALVESMKMEHSIRASHSGQVVKIYTSKGASITIGDHLLLLRPTKEGADLDMADSEQGEREKDVNVMREDLQLVAHRKHLLTDEFRVKAVEKRKAAGFLTARENLDLLVDKGSFLEYGDFAVAAQRTRMDKDRLLETTSGDGVITGWATVNKDGLKEEKKKFHNHHSSDARCALVIYDYMVLAGTQGHFHHLKLDRIFRSVLDNPAPLILYAEGGGGRPGDVDLANLVVGGLNTPSFALMALIRSRGYPSIGLANGYTFAGNAALLGTCDIVVATRGGGGGGGERGKTSTGMGGPAMIEGGGLGVVKPEDVGPVSIHEANGDYDVIVTDEKEASVIIKRLLSFFQGPLQESHWKYTKDSKTMRTLLPSNRIRAYDVRTVINTICDDESFIELGKAWGKSLLTGLGRIQGEAIAIIASSVLSPLGGAIDSESARKASRFLKMLDRTKVAHLCVLCDTPGFMVGPEAEKQGGVRSFADFFESVVAFQDGHQGGRVFAITLRKGYGLGAQALLGGSTLNNFFSISWPQGEFGGMGLEGAVRLGMKKELEAVKDEQEQKELYQSFVDLMYQRGKSENMAMVGEIDTVIDPKDTRSWLINGLQFVQPRIPRWKHPHHTTSRL